jgi:hypothetical protein
MAKLVAPLVAAFLAGACADPERTQVRTTLDPAKLVGSWKITSAESAGEKVADKTSAAALTSPETR